MRDAGCMMKMTATSVYGRAVARNLSMRSVRLPSKVIFHQRWSSIKGDLPSKVFHQRVSSIKGRLPSKVVFYRRSSSIEGRLPSKVVLHRRSSSIGGHLPSKVVFHRRSSSAPMMPPSYPRSESSNYGLGRLDNKLTGTGRQTGGRTGPHIESGWCSD